MTYLTNGLLQDSRIMSFVTPETDSLTVNLDNVEINLQALWDPNFKDSEKAEILDGYKQFVEMCGDFPVVYESENVNGRYRIVSSDELTGIWRITRKDL